MANHVEADRLPDAAPMRIFKLAWGATATVLSVLYTFLLAPWAALGARLGFYRQVSALSRWWAWMIIRTCGIKVEIEGLEHIAGLKSYILVCNHQSFFDIFAVLAYMPGDMRFVAKKELLKIPLVGAAMKHNGHIIVDRQGGGRSIRRAIEQARNNYPICVFAEGHRFNDGSVHEFNEGAAWLAVRSKLPCVPMAICGSGAFFPREAKVVSPGGRMKMKLGAPVRLEDMPAGREGTRELTHRLEDAVRAMFEPEL